MPIYEYRCDNGHLFEVMQKMSDGPVTECETCGAPVQRVFHPVAVHFKGSGFYNTDYGKQKRGRSADGEGEGGKSDGAAETKKSDGDSGASSGESKSSSGEGKSSTGDSKGSSDSKGSGDSGSKKSPSGASAPSSA